MSGKLEKDFEAEIEQHLLTKGGYLKSFPTFFRPDVGVDTAELFTFIGATQAEEWERIIHRYGGDADRAQKGFVSRLGKELDKQGTVALLRDGIKDQGVKIRLAYFKPATTMNDTLTAKYAANRLTITRQLAYSTRNSNTLDTGLLLNGLLVATVELKNPLTGQNVEHAMRQYRKDRDPVKDPNLSRAIVHFAVDPYLAYMTTKLALDETSFLPFNKGRDGGKGNPDNPENFNTSYLWEQVWEREAWLDILARFVQVSDDRRVIFPRFHQWDAVVKIEADAKSRGAGHNYLVQHSAGSGKSNSISWLAHRLSTLHNAANGKVFDKVVVITDRRVLDEQLRGNLQQFERTQGVVQAVIGKGGSKSTELADALTSTTSRIVITTLQTFPFVLEQLDSANLSGRHWAVIVDEAHSSQTGDAAAALRQAIGAGVDIDGEVDAESALAAVLQARGHQPNLSFFAFTATPKNKTVEIFGTLQPGGNKGPFHLYSMRQAIEEGFILDVLKNYTTYKTYYRLATTSDEAAQKEVEVGKAGSALRSIMVKHPEVIAQKARLMVEHYLRHTAHKIGGQGKAMVVTDSRAAAVKYKEAIDAYVAEKGYPLASLVAFSGTVNDLVVGEVSESSLNGFPESQTADRFKGVDPYALGDYQVLIVAEKFQTGFDYPALHTMFVDKTLTGLAVVQTLSRLNRTMPGKDDTFVLDFRNDADDIRAAFQQYYDATTTEPTDVNVLSDAYDRTLNFGVADEAEMAAVVETYFVSTVSGPALGKVYAAFNPALTRFGALDDQEQEEFRAALGSFLTLYAFMSQVMIWTEPGCEQLYIYGKALAHLLPTRPDGRLDLGSDVVLTHLRIEDQGLQDVELLPGQGEPGKAFPGEGLGKEREGRRDKLGNITDDLNSAFGLNLTERDRLAFEQFEESWVTNSELRDVANNNDLDGFRLEFEKVFKSTVLENEEANQDLYNRIYNDDKFGKRVLDWYLERMYQLFRADAAGSSGTD